MDQIQKLKHPTEFEREENTDAKLFDAPLTTPTSEGQPTSRSRNFSSAPDLPPSATEMTPCYPQRDRQPPDRFESLP